MPIFMVFSFLFTINAYNRLWGILYEHDKFKDYRENGYKLVWKKQTYSLKFVHSVQQSTKVFKIYVEHALLLTHWLLAIHF